MQLSSEDDGCYNPIADVTEEEIDGYINNCYEKEIDDELAMLDDSFDLSISTKKYHYQESDDQSIDDQSVDGQNDGKITCQKLYEILQKLDFFFGDNFIKFFDIAHNNLTIKIDTDILE